MGCSEIPVGCSVLSAGTGFGVCTILPVQKSMLLHFAFVLTSVLRLVEGRSGGGRSWGPPKPTPYPTPYL